MIVFSRNRDGAIDFCKRFIDFDLGAVAVPTEAGDEVRCDTSITGSSSFKVVKSPVLKSYSSQRQIEVNEVRITASHKYAEARQH